MSPCDAARYARLLEGLEVVELMLSEVGRNNEKLRLDSGYFAKPMLVAEKTVRAYPGGCDDLNRVFSRFIKGIFDINADSYTETGVPFLRILNIKHGLIDETNLAMIPEATHQQEAKTALRRGDVVLSKTAYPAASLVTLDTCNTSQDTVATTMSEYGSANYKPEVVVSYLNSSIGRQLLWRQFQGNVQLHLSLDDGRKVPIPRFGAPLQNMVARAFHLAQQSRSASREAFRLAELVLVGALGLENWQGPDPLGYVRRSSEAFAAHRLDAQFFAPRVQALLSLLGRDGLTVASVAPPRHQAFDPDNVGPTFQYIEIGDVRSDATVGSTELASVEAPSRATQHVKAGDVVTSTVRPIRRLSAIVDASQDGAVCSSGFVVLNPAGISSATLVTYLRLPLVCELMDLHCSASLYPAIAEKDLLGLPIPWIEDGVQRKIEALVEAARASRGRAAQLLEAAKRAVEIAIEDSEAAALAYLDQVAPHAH